MELQVQQISSSYIRVKTFPLELLIRLDLNRHCLRENRQSVLFGFVWRVQHGSYFQKLSKIYQERLLCGKQFRLL